MLLVQTYTCYLFKVADKTLLHTGIEVKLDIGLPGISFNSLSDRHFRLLLRSVDVQTTENNLQFAPIILPTVHECCGGKLSLSRPAAARVFYRDGVRETKTFFATCPTCKTRYYKSFQSEYVEVQGQKREIRKYYEIKGDLFQMSMRSVFECELLLDLSYQGLIYIKSR